MTKYEMTRYKISKKTNEEILKIVKEDGMALMFVIKQTPEICLAAVRNNGWALCDVINQTPEICLAAVRNNCMALRFVNPEFLTEDGTKLKSFKQKLTKEEFIDEIYNKYLEEKI